MSQGGMPPSLPGSSMAFSLRPWPLQLATSLGWGPDTRQWERDIARGPVSVHSEGGNPQTPPLTPALSLTPTILDLDPGLDP